MRFKKNILAILFLWGTMALYAQSETHTDSTTAPRGDLQEWAYWLELWAEMAEDDGAVEEFAELYYLYSDHPINLNDTNNQDLEALCFISPFQRSALKAYIQQHGQLLSMNELELINGFDDITRHLLLPICTAGPLSDTRHISLKEMCTRGHSNLLVGSNGTIEQARGYRDSIYEGNNLRLYYRYLYRYRDNLQIQLSADKDPGEALFRGSQRQGFDFYGGHLMLSNMGKLRKLIVGQYKLQFGQGLTLWSGFAPYSAIGSEIYRYGQGIGAASAFAEYGYLQGIATTVELFPHWELTAFYSNADRSATLPRGASADTNVVQSIYQSGYHRTATEIAKKGLLNEQLYGGHLQYQKNNLRIGLTGVRTLFDKSIQPLATIYNQFYFRGDNNTNVGIDAAYHYRRLLFFGEAAMSQNLGYASIGGMQWQIASHSQFSAYYRNYSIDYQNHHSAALGRNSATQNEEGFCMNLSTQLPFSITAVANADWFRFPWLKYRVYDSSHGCEYRLALSRPITTRWSASLRYRYTEKGRNAMEDELAQYVIEQTRRQQLQCDIEYHTPSGWAMKTRAMWAHFGCDMHESEQGVLLFEDISYRPQHRPITLATRIALFDVSAYDARLYMSESDMAYSYGSLSLQDAGCRFYLLLHYDVSQDLSISAKYAITNYDDKESIGSSYEKIEGSHRQTWKVQLRWKF